MNMLDQVSEMLDDALSDHKVVGFTVQYARDIWSIELTASAGFMSREQSSTFGLAESYEGRDFLLRASDLVIAGQLTKPQAGDKITHGSRVYEVMPVGDEPVFRYMDPNHTWVRVHTKQVQDDT
jgi:hypothetical protein